MTSTGLADKAEQAEDPTNAPGGTQLTRTSRSGSMSSSSSNGSETAGTTDNQTSKARKQDRRKAKYTYRTRKKRRQLAKQKYHAKTDSVPSDEQRTKRTAGATGDEEESSGGGWTKTWTQCVGHLGEEERHKKIVMKYGSMLSRLDRIRKIEEVWRALNEDMQHARNRRDVPAKKDVLAEGVTNGDERGQEESSGSATTSKKNWLSGWFPSSLKKKSDDSDCLLNHLIMGYTQEDGLHPEIRLNEFVPPSEGGKIPWDNVLYIRVETKIVWQRFGVKIKIVREHTSVSNPWLGDGDQQGESSNADANSDNNDDGLDICSGICICVATVGMIFIVFGLWLFAHFHRS